MMLTVMDMPKWKEKVIYTMLRIVGYKDKHFMLLDISSDSVVQPERIANVVWKDHYDPDIQESFEE